MTQPPRLAITTCDPAGIGPEIIVKACRRLRSGLEAGELRLLIIGHRSALRAAQVLLHEPWDIPDADPALGQPLALLVAGEEGRRSELARSARKPAASPISRSSARLPSDGRTVSAPSSPRR